MTYQIIYSSRSKMPMQSEDLDELLEDSRIRNGIHGISGALIYVDGAYLQILEGDREKVRTLMDTIERDVRHESVSVLREGEVPSARFSSWKMAYVSATPEQVAQWTGSGVSTRTGVGEDVQRTAQFVRDILALLTSKEPRGADGTATEATITKPND